MELSRKLKTFLAKKYREKRKRERLNIFIKYAPLTALAISELTGKDKEYVEKLIIKKIGEEYNENLQSE